MIAGQRWSAATKRERIAPLPGALFMLISAMMASPLVQARVVRRAAESGDGEQKVRRLRWISCNGQGLGFAIACNKAGKAPLPSSELPVQKGAACGIIRQRRQMGVHAGDEMRGAIGLLGAG